MHALDDHLAEIMQTPGALNVSLVEYPNGRVLTEAHRAFPARPEHIVIAVRAVRVAVSGTAPVNADNTEVEDIVLTVGTGHLLVAIVRVPNRPVYFLQALVDRTIADLGLARSHTLLGAARIAERLERSRPPGAAAPPDRGERKYHDSQRCSGTTPQGTASGRLPRRPPRAQHGIGELTSERRGLRSRETLERVRDALRALCAPSLTDPWRCLAAFR